MLWDFCLFMQVLDMLLALSKYHGVDGAAGRGLVRHMMGILPLQVLWRPLEEAMMIQLALQLEVFPLLPHL